MGSRVQSTVGCFPELCVLQFSGAHVLVRLRKQFINNLVFALGSVLLVLIILIIIIIIIIIIKLKEIKTTMNSRRQYTNNKFSQ